jgi:polygalacturonase
VNSASPLLTTKKRAKAAGRKLEEGVSDMAASLTAGAASAVAAAATVANAAGVAVDPAALETAVEVLLAECSSW